MPMCRSRDGRSAAYRRRLGALIAMATKIPITSAAIALNPTVAGSLADLMPKMMARTKKAAGAKAPSIPITSKPRRRLSRLLWEPRYSAAAIAGRPTAITIRATDTPASGLPAPTPIGNASKKVAGIASKHETPNRVINIAHPRAYRGGSLGQVQGPAHQQAPTIHGRGLLVSVGDGVGMVDEAAPCRH